MLWGSVFEHLPLLAKILDQCPEVSVIVSSNWRLIYSLAELQEFFGAHGHRVIGTTTSIDVKNPVPTNRFQECRAATEQLGVSNWVMVDDQPGIVWDSQIPTPDLARRVIWCDPVLGLGTPLVANVIMERFRDAT